VTVNETADRIVRALQSGPTYEGLLAVVVDSPRFATALRLLMHRGVIERDLPANPQTWRLTS
jgi:hypothetical protein